MVPSFTLLQQRFYVQKWVKFEPLYLSNESAFFKNKKSVIRMFKAKRHRKSGYKLPQTDALITSADNS